MAKRVRGKRAAYRPGGQGPSRSGRAADDASSGETAFEPAAADIDDAIDVVAGEYTEVTLAEAEPAAAPGTTKRRRTRRSARAQAESLEGRAAAENIYVREDLRRIGVISGILFAGLAIAWVLFVALDILDVY